MNFRVLLSLAFVTAGALLQSCGPRGETQSLSQILEEQRNRLRQAESSAADAAKAPLGALVAKLAVLETATNKSQVQSDSTAVATMLSGLTYHAGYTSRPAFAEITKQYRAIGENPDFPVIAAEGEGIANVRLLVSRTYSMLSSELESTKFAL